MPESEQGENLDKSGQLLDDSSLENQNNQDEFTKSFKPKTVLFFLVLFVSLGLVFSVAATYNSLKIPFAQNGADLNSLNANLSLTNSQVGQILAQQNQDTDQDGLSDYDELNNYKTSPYLPDTDSDGYTDFEEVQNNYNPNCPEGAICQAESETTENTADVSDGTALIEEIKQLLRAEGYSQEQIDSLDDQALMDFYNQAVAQTGDNSGFSDLVQDEFQTITIEQIKQLLLEQGISQEQLSGISDDELLELWQSALNQQEEIQNEN